MKKMYALTLMCVVCVGCQTGGQRWPWSSVSSTPSAGDAATSPLAASGASANPGSGVAANVAASPAAHAAGESTAGGPVSSFGKIWNAAFFIQQDASPEPAGTPPEVARFNGFVASLTAQTNQLNPNDPPEVTRQKAEAILTTLRDWDTVLAAGRSTGWINDGTAQVMTQTVQRLTAEAQKLTQFAPRPETIQAVRQLGGSIGATYSRLQGLMGGSQLLGGQQPQ